MCNTAFRLIDLEEKYDENNDFDSSDIKEITEDLLTIMDENQIDAIKLVLRNHYGNVVLDWISDV